MLLIFLGILIIPIGFATAPKDRTAAWFFRLGFFLIGAVLIILGILFRIHRWG